MRGLVSIGLCAGLCLAYPLQLSGSPIQSWDDGPDPAPGESSPSASVVRIVPEAPGSLTDSALDSLVSEREATVARVLTVLGSAAPSEGEIDVLAYATTEAKALATGSERWAHLDPPTETIHAVIGREVRGDRLGLEATLLFRRALGSPALPVLEAGVAAFFSTEWGGRGFEYWAARLHRGGLVPPLATLLSGGWSEQASPFVVQPVAGALVAYLLDRWSRTGFADRYSHWQPGADEIQGLESGWTYFLDALLLRNRSPILRDLGAARWRARATGPQLRGVNYAHEGYRRYDGYLSERSDESLARIAEMGANAVAVLPYAFMSSPSTPVALRPPTRAGTETDEAVVRAIRAARDRGLVVLLKPHIWLRGSWPGEIEMSGGRDWDRFFDHYERWIVHYALLAEIHEVPLFSLGVELSTATMGREERWEDLVRKVRGIYSGALVYAANWGEEFESLSFWDVFDYLGIDAYYPLSDDPDASDRELRQGADAMLDRIERVQRRYSKPVLFTEIGFASARGAWVRPWEGNRVDEASPTDQLRSYRAVIGAMEGREWIGGVFWWEWPSDLRRAARDRRGFMPTGKPAEALLSEWFSGPTPARRAEF